MIRFELTAENERKVLAAIQQLRDEHGVQISPNRYINIVLTGIEAVEFHQDVIVTLKSSDVPASQGHQPPPPKKQIRRTTTWMSGLK